MLIFSPRDLNELPHVNRTSRNGTERVWHGSRSKIDCSIETITHAQPEKPSSETLTEQTLKYDALNPSTKVDSSSAKEMDARSPIYVWTLQLAIVFCSNVWVYFENRENRTDQCNSVQNRSLTLSTYLFINYTGLQKKRLEQWTPLYNSNVKLRAESKMQHHLKFYSNVFEISLDEFFFVKNGRLFH